MNNLKSKRRLMDCQEIVNLQSNGKKNLSDQDALFQSQPVEVEAVVVSQHTIFQTVLFDNAATLWKNLHRTSLEKRSVKSAYNQISKKIAILRNLLHALRI